MGGGIKVKKKDIKYIAIPLPHHILLQSSIYREIYETALYPLHFLLYIIANKSGINFNIFLNNHIKTVKRPKPSPWLR